MKTSGFNRKMLAALLAAVLLAAVFCTPGMAAFKVKVNSSSAKIYSSPSSSSASIKGSAGTTLSCSGYTSNWARVSYKGKTGYMKLADLNLVDRIKAYTKSSTAVYRSASSSSKIGTLSGGSTVYVVGFSGDYIRIQDKSGSVTGYVKSSQISQNSAYKSSSSSSSSSSKTSAGASKLTKLLSTAKAQLGKPYGHSAPNKFDCSSFVRYCYSKAGYSVPRTAAKQAAYDKMAKVDKVSSLRVGDIICFDTDKDGTCDHVALSLGGNKFVEASQGAGKVRTNKFNSYYKRVFMWGRRVK